MPPGALRVSGLGDRFAFHKYLDRLILYCEPVPGHYMDCGETLFLAMILPLIVPPNFISLAFANNSTPTHNSATLVQPVVLPSLSTFNTVPSAHLHILARSNNPVLAMCFSTPMAILYLVSTTVTLVSCSSPATSAPPSGFQRAECPVKFRPSSTFEEKTGPSQGVWEAVVALWLCSAVGYTVHVAMAWQVRRVLKKRVADVSCGDANAADLVVMDAAAKARMEQQARERWARIRDL